VRPGYKETREIKATKGLLDQLDLRETKVIPAQLEYRVIREIKATKGLLDLPERKVIRGT
jgi:hypothetical protein